MALAAARRTDGAVLVQRGIDPTTGQPFHRLVGGGIDFGESAEEAVVREWQEELGTELREVRLLGWVENRFVFDGSPAHEVLAVHVGVVTEPRVLERDDLGAIPGSDATMHWVGLDELLHGPAPLYPEALGELWADWLAGPQPG